MSETKADTNLKLSVTLDIDVSTERGQRVLAVLAELMIASAGEDGARRIMDKVMDAFNEAKRKGGPGGIHHIQVREPIERTVEDSSE